MSGLDGKVIAITGASSGIGEATAKHLAERGAAVMLGARRLERLEGLAAEIGRSVGKAEAMTVDAPSVRISLYSSIEQRVDSVGSMCLSILPASCLFRYWTS
jgi:NADP-dependent 3-hydroxy acid dehydrogenase YdfG